MSDSKNRSVLPIAAGLAGLTALSYYALRVEPFLVERTHTEIPLRRLPAALDGLRILFIADLHSESWGEREEKVEQLACSTPDPELIVWGGDFLRRRRGVPSALRLVKAVAERFPGVPTFAILGNAEHKLMLRERHSFIKDMEAFGVDVMLNEHRTLILRGEPITIVAVDDPYYGHADLDAALEGVPPVSERFTLLLAHSPQIATQAARAGVDLMLSGHTHGGQVRLPFLGPLKTQNPLCRRLDMGLFDHKRLVQTLGYDPGGDLTVYITRGLGLANLPGLSWAAPRFLCRPEVSVLTLRSAKP